VEWRHAAAISIAGLPLVRLGVWIKPNSAPQLTGDRPATGWEAVAIFHRPGKKRWNGGGSRAVWTINRVDAVLHPTEKPIKLMVRFVTLFSQESETILDPFMGSGTTGVACIQTERQFIGIEKEEKYFDIACDRIQRAWDLKCSELPFEKPEPEKQLAMFGDDEPHN
jgi:site-specific DNA-methyltransferase (adenine-specific)